MSHTSQVLHVNWAAGVGVSPLECTVSSVLEGDAMPPDCGGDPIIK